MIRLYPFIDLELTDDDDDDEFVTREAYEAAVDYLTDAWDNPPTHLFLTLNAADTSDGRTIRDLRFLVEARYMSEGDRFFSGGGFEVSIDKMLKLVEGMVKD